LGQTPDPPVVIVKTYDLALWLLPKVEKLPRSYRFTLGQRITDTVLDLLLALVDASYRRDKGSAIRAASAKVNALRYLLRLSKDLRFLPLDAYHHVGEKLDEIGRMVGGWEKKEGGSLAPGG
jgi:hypothetical protein